MPGKPPASPGPNAAGPTSSRRQLAITTLLRPAHAIPAAPGDNPLEDGRLARSGSGVFRVTVGRRPWDRLLARRFGFRGPGPATVGLDVEPVPGGQRWRRTIDGRDVTSLVGWQDGMMVERFGPTWLLLLATTRPQGAGLDLAAAGIVAGPIVVRLPRWLVPHVTSDTEQTDGGLWVEVEVRSPLGRPMLSYRGTVS